MIVIPAIDLMNGKCVRLTRGEKSSQKVYDADPVAAARQWAEAGAQRIHVVDLDGAFEGGFRNLDVLASIVKAVDVPIEMGGGIRDPQAVDRLIEIGVAFIVIGTLAVEKPQLAAELIAAHPGQIYIGIDTRAGHVMTHGWVTTSEKSYLELAERAAEWQARGIVFTAIERDGELMGPDLNAIRELTEETSLPVIASGGVTTAADLKHLAAIPRVEGAIVGKALYEGRIGVELIRELSK